MLKISSKKDTIALDFDGVIHSYVSGWTGEEPKDAPVVGAKKFVDKLQNKGFEVVIFSTRASTDSGKAGIEEYLKKHGFPKIKVFHEKPKAKLFVDDRGFRFEGDFDKVLSATDNMDPWYEKSSYKKRG